MRGRIAAVAACVGFTAAAAGSLPAVEAIHSALFVVRHDEYGRPVSGPEVSLHTLALATGLSFAYVGRTGTGDFDFELYRGTPAGLIAIDFRQDGLPAGAALRRS
jgi:hypothetical protein